MDFLTNPYVIIFIVVAVVVSNIMALKYTANAKFGLKDKLQHKKEQPTEDKSPASESADDNGSNGSNGNNDKPSV